MSRTCKWEHKRDTWRIGNRLERQARPAGRLQETIEFELTAEGNSNMQYQYVDIDRPQGKVHVRTIRCPTMLGGCNRDEEITVTISQWEAYNSGVLIQDAFPDLTPAQRERLVSGFCDPCFDRLMAEEIAEEMERDREVVEELAEEAAQQGITPTDQAR